MIKKHFLLLFYQIKICIKYIPLLILCSVVFAAIIACVGINSNKKLNKSDKAISIDVAAVIKPDDTSTEAIYSLINSMDSVTSICNFIKVYEEDEACRMLENEEVMAIIIFPEDFYNVLLSGENTPVNIIIPENAGFESLYFCSMINSGAATLANSEAAIYAITDSMEMADVPDSSKHNDAIYNIFLKNTLNRGKLFSISTTSSTGSISLEEFYIISGIVLLLAMSMLSLLFIYRKYPDALIDKLKTERISLVYTRFCQLMGMAFMFFIMYIPFYIIAANTFAADYLCVNACSIFALFAIITALSSYIMFFCCIGDCQTISAILIFFFTSFFMYAAGRIVPAAYLPDIIEKAGRYLPFAHICRLGESLVCGRINTSALYNVLAYSAVFFTISSLTTYLRWRKHK